MISLAGRYTLNTPFRETSRAVLHRGCRDHDGCPVVVKTVRAEHPSPADLARLRHEYAILKSLELPQVVRAFGLEPFGHGLALVLRDVGQVSLDMLLRGGPVRWDRALEIAISLADVVASVHKSGIVHKDIKPHHLFLAGEESTDVTLIDFGTAIRSPRQLQAAVPITRLEGSLPYIAPEQTGRMNRVVDHRSDLYSIGVVLFELFTGRLPFENTDALELVHSHIARIPPSVCDIRPETPTVVGEIIAKLMAKEAEKRYQSAEGLRYDLVRCRARLPAADRSVADRSEDVAGFRLAERDATGDLRLSQKLYGREVELGELGTSLIRVEQGGVELFLLSGASGMGKSALVSELRSKLGRGSRMVSGKFDQLGRGVPYAALAHACRELVQSLLGEPAEALARYRQALTEALGPNGQLVVDLVPDLELIIGPQPTVFGLGPDESQRRFEITFENFIGVFCTAEQPLVLFLDDLQWADAASLRLVQLVLSGGHRLILGAYRSNEISETHPLPAALDAIRKDGVRVRELVLEPLGLSQVTELLSETLVQSQDRVEPLARVLRAKTQGNPFFLNQFLAGLHQDGLLVWDLDRYEWTWDLDEIEARRVTDNVVDFLLARLRNLSSPTQHTLSLAACIGDQFDGQTLGVVARCTQSDLGAALLEAIREGQILALDSNFRYAADPDAGTTEDLRARYRFLHDRVRQAAYDLIGEGKKAEIHLTIGRLLLARAGDDPSDDELFIIADHLGRGEELVRDPRERVRFARLILRAGRRARDAAAPAAAAHYLEISVRLLGDDAWSRHYDIVYPAYLTLAECKHLIREAASAFQLLYVAEERAASVLDRVAVRNLRTGFLTTAGRTLEACTNSIGSLRLLGTDLPLPDDKPAMGAAIGAEFGAYQAALGGRSIESLADLPVVSAPERLAVMDTLAVLIPPAYMAYPELHAAIVIKGVSETLRHGTAPVTPFFYVQYAVAHMVITGDMPTAYRFGRLGIDLSARVGAPALAGPALGIFGGLIAHFREKASDTIRHIRHAFKLNLELGDILHAGFAGSDLGYQALFAGQPLRNIEAELPLADEVARRIDDFINLQFNEIVRGTVRALKGHTRQLDTFDCAGFDEAELVHRLAPPGWSWYVLFKTQLLFLAGCYAEALTTSLARPQLPATPGVPEIAFYRALSLAQLSRTAESSERKELIERLEGEARTLESWAASAPCNYGARHDLVLAELAAIRGELAAAMQGYDRAIAGAKQEGFLQVEGIANELCGRFHLAAERTTIARAYLKEAVYAYERWGATGKVRLLRTSHARLLGADGSTSSMDAFETNPATASTTQVDETDQAPTNRTGASGRLDLATAIRATEALATELVFDKVLERLMRALLENAGAQRGFLVVDRKGSLRIEAAITIDPDAVRLGFSEELERAEGISRSIVHYVARTAEPLILGDASRDPRFATDPYVSGCQPKSVLAVALMHRAKVTGVLYLENNTATDAFGPGRAELLQFLAVQAAAAFENARLYGELQAASDDLRRANETLEAQVAQRTEELRRALAEVWSEMDLARKIQTVLLPKTTRLADYDVAAAMIPADSVGGDYYDIVETESGGFLLIGDVAGHGVPAGLVMMMVQSAVRALLVSAPGEAKGISPATLLSRANAAVFSNLQRIGQAPYMTIMALALSRGRALYSGLHQDILVYRQATSALERIETRGIWIGLEQDISNILQDNLLELDQGDTVLLFTDGISELDVGGRMLGTDLPARFLALASQGHDPGTIVRGILEPVSGSTLKDDVTVLVFRYAP